MKSQVGTIQNLVNPWTQEATDWRRPKEHGFILAAALRSRPSPPSTQLSLHLVWCPGRVSVNDVGFFASSIEKTYFLFLHFVQAAEGGVFELGIRGETH